MSSHSRDDSAFYKTNLWASGPILKDRLFFFAMYEQRDSNSRDIDTIEAWVTRGDNAFWGGKLDWRINDNHLLELLAFSDKAKSATTTHDYVWDTPSWGRRLARASAVPVARTTR